MDLDTYKCTTGIALIINNREFDRKLNLPDRTGSDVDASSLMQRFIELGFDSDLLNDVTAKEIGEKFDESNMLYFLYSFKFVFYNPIACENNSKIPKGQTPLNLIIQ